MREMQSPPVTTGKDDASPMDRVWRFFTSVKLAVFTLIVLAAASVLGTLVEQNLPREKYHEIYEDWAFALMDRIDLFDMYHSWWFLALLMVFTVNLACCTIDRFPKALSVVRNPRTKLDDGLVKTLPLVDRWKKKGAAAECAPQYAEALTSLFAKPLVTEEGDEIHMYAEAGMASRFGVYVTHLSIIVIFLGAIVGNIAGFKGFVNIREGDSVSAVQVRGGSRTQDFGFALRCNSFRVDTYPSGQPKAYVSDLSVIEGGGKSSARGMSWSTIRSGTRGSGSTRRATGKRGERWRGSRWAGAADRRRKSSRLPRTARSTSRGTAPSARWNTARTTKGPVRRSR